MAAIWLHFAGGLLALSLLDRPSCPRSVLSMAWDFLKASTHIPHPENLRKPSEALLEMPTSYCFSVPATLANVSSQRVGPEGKLAWKTGSRRTRGPIPSWRWSSIAQLRMESTHRVEKCRRCRSLLNQEIFITMAEIWVWKSYLLQLFGSGNGETAAVVIQYFRYFRYWNTFGNTSKFLSFHAYQLPHYFK